MPKKRWSNEKGQLTFSELWCYPLAPTMKRSIISKSHSNPPMCTSPLWSSEAGKAGLFLGWWSCSSKCPNSEICPNSSVRGLDREAGKRRGLRVPIWSLSFAIQITSHMFTLVKKSLPPKCLSQCGLFNSNLCRFSLPLKTNCTLPETRTWGWSSRLKKHVMSRLCC